MFENSVEISLVVIFKTIMRYHWYCEQFKRYKNIIQRRGQVGCDQNSERIPLAQYASISASWEPYGTTTWNINRKQEVEEGNQFLESFSALPCLRERSFQMQKEKQDAFYSPLKSGNKQTMGVDVSMNASLDVCVNQKASVDVFFSHFVISLSALDFHRPFP